jgi:hypothetical protein
MRKLLLALKATRVAASSISIRPGCRDNEDLQLLPSASDNTGLHL